jgi:hypothetical protein
MANVYLLYYMLRLLMMMMLLMMMRLNYLMMHNIIIQEFTLRHVVIKNKTENKTRRHN